MPLDKGFPSPVTDWVDLVDHGKIGAAGRAVLMGSRCAVDANGLQAASLTSGLWVRLSTSTRSEQFHCVLRLEAASEWQEMVRPGAEVWMGGRI